MATHGRYFRTKPKTLMGTNYDSMMEKRLHDAAPELNHHSEKFEYVRYHTYNPDFVIEIDGVKLLVEAKGYFQDAQELSKYVPISEQLPENCKLVFVFEKKDKPIHFQAKRKDGTKLTHSEWCSKRGFDSYSESEFIEFLNKDLNNE